ncbi:MAG: dihydroorotase [Gammaproteobacteria bacterium]|nr:dihydroorotase [Gammaproteobacteria bacterium]
MKILIQGGHLVDPANGVDAQLDLFLEGGLVASVGEAPAGFEPDQVIDASGQIVCPGFVDLQARLREPGQEHKGSIDSETRAAARGGITTLCCPPDTSPVIDTPAVAKLVQERADQAARVRVAPIGALTTALEGEQLSEMVTLAEAGCIAFSNADLPVHNTLVLRRAMEYAASHSLLLMLQPQDAWLAAKGCVHEGVVGLRLGLSGIPESAETVELSRILMLVEQTGARVHFGQLSTGRAVQILRQAKRDGLPVSADVAAHQLHLTEMDLLDYSSDCHVIPPLRTQRDRDSLREGLRDGTLIAISSDHQPHDADAKLAPFAESEPGISALETLLPLTLRLVDEGVLSLEQAIACLTSGPASVIDNHNGHLGVGARADVCIFDPQQHWRLDAQTMQSAGHNTPFLGWDLKGRVTHTLLNGRLSYQEPSKKAED